MGSIIFFFLLFPVLGSILIYGYFKNNDNRSLYLGLTFFAFWGIMIRVLFFSKSEPTPMADAINQVSQIPEKGGNEVMKDNEIIKNEDYLDDEDEELDEEEDEEYEEEELEEDEEYDDDDTDDDEEEEEEDDDEPEDDDEDEEYDDDDDGDDYTEDYEEETEERITVNDSKKNKRRRYNMNNSFDSLFLIRALPNEYLVRVGKKQLSVVLGGTAFRLFRKYIKVPASSEITSFEIECSTSNYLGVIVEGYVAWRIDVEKVETAIRSLDFNNISNPLEKTSNLIRDMVKDAVRRSIAEIKVSEILKSSEKLKVSIEGILKDVSTWGLLVDTIGINKIYIKSENVYDDLQAEDRNSLHLTSEVSGQQTNAKIEEDKIEHAKELQVQQSKLKETEIREKMKQEKMKAEADMDEVRLKKEKEKDEIRLSQELEKSRYGYQKERSIHDRELQQHRYVMDLKNLEIAERKRIVEGGLTDRELTELISEKLSTISSMYKDANLTIIGDKADAMSSIIAPIQAVTGLIRGFINSSKKPAQVPKQKD